MGLGNPIMGDDRVGIHIARRIRARIPQTTNIEVKELSVSGIRLVEEILGFDRVIIVDSHIGSETKLGHIRKFTPNDFIDTIHPGAPHGINFATALEFYKNLEPYRVPKLIEIYTIDIESKLSFGEQLSPTIESAAEELVDLIVRELGLQG